MTARPLGSQLPVRSGQRARVAIERAPRLGAVGLLPLRIEAGPHRSGSEPLRIQLAEAQAPGSQVRLQRRIQCEQVGALLDRGAVKLRLDDLLKARRAARSWRAGWRQSNSRSSNGWIARNISVPRTGPALRRDDQPKLRQQRLVKPSNHFQWTAKHPGNHCGLT